jgi:hypothetical protein
MAETTKLKPDASLEPKRSLLCYAERPSSQQIPQAPFFLFPCVLAYYAGVFLNIPETQVALW